MNARSDVLPLSAAQAGIWWGQQLDPTSPLYNTAEALEIEGPLDVPAFLAALQTVLAGCEALHRRFVAHGDTAEQHACVPPEPCTASLDWRGRADARAAMWTWIAEDLRRPVDLAVGPLYRSVLFTLADDHHVWLLRAHHIALDGFAFSLLRERLWQHYRALVQGSAPPRPVEIGLRDVIAEDQAYAASPDHAADRAFWCTWLADQPCAVSFARTSANAGPEVHRHRMPLADTWPPPAPAACKTSWPELVMATVAAALHDTHDHDDLVLGLPMMGTMGSLALRVPCMSMNIVPLRIRWRATSSLATRVEAIGASLRRLRPHARYRYEQLRRDLRRVGGGRRLFGPVLNILPWGQPRAPAGLRCTLHPISAGPVEDLSIAVWGGVGDTPPTVYLDGNAQLYDAATLTEIGARLRDTWTAIVTGLQRAPTPGSTPSEPPPPDVLDAFRSHVERTPEAIAIEDGDTALTYAELDRRARVVEARLRDAGVVPESLVAIDLPRGATAIAAMLGTLRLGAAYLPLDPEGPVERNASIVRAARPHATLTCTSLRAHAEAFGVPIIDAEADAAPIASDIPTTGPEALGYVLYTSGSTGTPHGVMISRRNLASFVHAAAQRYGWTKRDRVLQFAPLHFDASVEEIFVTLALGATLVLRTTAMMDSLEAFVDACAERRITVLDLPTAFWHELAFAMAHRGLTLPPAVRCVIIGGEAALPERVADWRRVAPPGTALLNTYGPTETTVVATCAALHDHDDGEIPIGRPLAGIDVLVVDDQGRVCAPGETGELWILGPTLARGYSHDPELTARRFVTCTMLAGHPRAYRTGDRVRQREDGQLVFVGRVDHEVKISGHRIDPSAVEHVLARCPGVVEVAVVVVVQGAQKHLVAHVHTTDPGPSEAELLTVARARLLPAAVPSRIVRSHALPKTRSGKIDRRALAQRTTALTPHATAPASDDPLERTVLAVWQEVLGRGDLGLEDDVFDRGAHSLQTIQVANRLSARLGRPIAVALIFRHPTVAGLAAALAPERAASPSPTASFEADATLAPHLVPTPTTAAWRPPETILLTGATGFVGVHLLDQLLTRTTARIRCLVRAPDLAAARERLHAARHESGLHRPADADRIEIIVADLAQPRFGLAEDTFRRLADDVDLIVHNAAAVNLVRPYASLRSVNVEATRQLLELAMTDRATPIYAISTIAVGPRRDTAPDVDERFFAAHRGLQDGYTQSKWVAERLLAQAHARGLPVCVLRLGRVVGPRATGWVNPQDILWRMLRTGLQRGVLPQLDLEEPWTPVDDIAAFVAELCRRPPPRDPVVHVTPEPPLRLADLYRWIRTYGYAFRECPWPQWHALVGAGRSDDERATLAFFDRDGTDAPPVAMGPILHATFDRLRGDLPCTAIDESLIHAYLQFCERAELLPPRSEARP